MSSKLHSAPGLPARGPVLAVLARWLEAHPLHRQRWSWEARNCCHFAGAWLAHRTGVHPMRGLPATATPRQAALLVNSLSGAPVRGTLQAAVSRRLGVASVPAGQAQPGDVVLFAGPGEVLAVCAGDVSYALDGAGELLRLTTARAACCWPLSAIEQAIEPAAAPQGSTACA